MNIQTIIASKYTHNIIIAMAIIIPLLLAFHYAKTALQEHSANKALKVLQQKQEEKLQLAEQKMQSADNLLKIYEGQKGEAREAKNNEQQIAAKLPALYAEQKRLDEQIKQKDVELNAAKQDYIDKFNSLDSNVDDPDL